MTSQQPNQWHPSQQQQPQPQSEPNYYPQQSQQNMPPAAYSTTSNDPLVGRDQVPMQPHHQHRIMQETPEELTEDELIEYEKGVMTWEKAKNWRFWFRKEWTVWYIIFILIVIVVALMAFFHHSIINWLEPFVRRIQSVKYGWLIPVAILFALSFPPLFGNEIVMVLVGLVWGLGRGFAIVAVGIILGEGANYLVFKFWCRGRAERMTKKSLNYACLSQAITEGGFLMAWIVRLSVIPTHFSTAVFAVCGLRWYHFFAALILALPKQLISVYVGVVLGNQNASTNSHVVSDCVFAATAIITLGALWFIYTRMLRVRKKVLIGMREDLRSKGVQIPQQYQQNGFDGGYTANQLQSGPQEQTQQPEYHNASR